MDDIERLQQVLLENKARLIPLTSDVPIQTPIPQFLSALFSASLSALESGDLSACAARAAACLKTAPLRKAELLEVFDKFQFATLQALESKPMDATEAGIMRLCRFFCEARKFLYALPCFSEDMTAEGGKGETRGILNRGGAIRLFDDVMHQILNPSIGPDAVLKMICDGAIRLSAAEAVAIFTMDRDTHSFLLKQFLFDARFQKAAKDKLPELLNVFTSIPRNPDAARGLFDVALSERKPVFCEDVTNDPRVHKPAVLKQLGITSMLVVPMMESDNELGFMSAIPSPGLTFTDDDIENLSLFADMAAVAWRNAGLYNELRKSEQQYRNLIDNATDVIFILDTEGKVISVNKRAEQLSGFKADHWLGRHFLELVSEEDREIAIASWQGGVQGRANILSIRVKDAQGRDILLKMNSSLIEQDGEITGLMCIARDATEEARREAEFKNLHQSVVETNRKLEESMAKLKSTQAKLVQTEKLSAMGELISGIAHELNNPLTGIMGYTQLLLETTEIPKQRQDLEKINQGALRCKQIIQNLLRFSRSHKPQRQRIDIHSIINSAIELKRYQLHLDGIKLKLLFTEEGRQVVGDPYQLQQVVLNVINNAHQSIVSSKIGGTIEIATAVDTNERRLRVIISDDGPGIPARILPKIFDPFFTTKEIGEGTGLGLSVAYGIMKEHGGQIFAESAPAKKTAFCLEFPLDKTPAPPDKEQSERAHSGNKKTNVLVVDDEEVILDLLTDILVQMEKQVERAHNGAEALKKVASKNFDIIICDLKMPGMDGKTFYHKIKETNPELTKRIIFSTGDTLGEDFRTFCSQTECKVVEKPFLLEDLKNAVETLEQSLLHQ